MGYSLSVRTELLADVLAEAAGSVVDIACLGDSTNGAQDNNLYYGTADMILDALLPIVGVCAGALLVRPWPRGGFIRAHPGDWPFDSQNFINTTWRMCGNETASIGTNYGDYRTAPTADDGAQTPPGEVNAADIRDTFCLMIPQGADIFASNGMHGALACGVSSDSAVIRGAYAQFPNASEWQYTTERFARYWAYRPKTGANVRGMSQFDLYWMRRDIPDDGGANEYNTPQLAYRVEQFNGSGDDISGDNAGTDIITFGSWSSMSGGSLATGTDYTLKKLSLTPAAATHGIGFHTVGAGYDQIATARGLAVMGVSSLYDGVTNGLRVARLTRSGFKANTLNDTIHDGTASDPQRVVLEAMNPALITLTFGHNSVGAGVTPAQYAASIITFCDRVWTYRPNQKIAYVSPYVGERGAALEKTLTLYLMEVRAHALSRPNLSIIDLTTPSLSMPKSFFGGSAHLNTNDSGARSFYSIVRDNFTQGRRASAFRPRHARRKGRVLA